ncbi:MAG: DNA-protecting protein DprA [Candidatus Desulforudis sp.]|nr:DNA-protecting protein DprA [Desulforudis sp.]
MEHLYWLAWAAAWPVGARRFLSLVERLGSAKRAWEAGERDLVAAGLDPALAAELAPRRAGLDPVAEHERLRALGARLITWIDEGYPESLRHIYDPPAVLFVLGEFDFRETAARVAVVGSRKATPYGRATARKLAADLGSCGLVIVSGMARGVDAAAHQGALDAGAPTVAVLGSGLDVVYPRENARLMEIIAAAGLVVSEFSLGSEPAAWHFPSRNRIISGLSRAVVVVEAAERSGALITAGLALEQGRDVMAVPGNVNNAYSRGPNRLIKQGARLVENAGDVIDELGLNVLFPGFESGEAGVAQLGKEERLVLDCLGGESLSDQALIELTGFSASRVASVLAYLEIKGFVRRAPGGLYYSLYHGR